ncbi:hypothetical protein [Marivita sp. XM-24bin2]|uniref:hypothetical protein n=1 Tax=unclassified Marivita TaxID=2632480 RepID=UPI000D79BF7B|nr:hypothetical protein [Marivita sp. XM-24bin2]MCR9110411.1 hypothetical protein [Paracoccaceae bacterium]PWL34888.1 MAG: hypothetical protein DCO97_12355 [Marivita sp. XM-24bin2]
MSAATEKLASRFKACPADGVRAEFGVCRGDPIRHIQDLILGDTFLPKRDANWLSVMRTDNRNACFALEMAANAPQQSLVTLAELIFMSTTGRRIDVFATVCNGALFFVSDTEFQANVEYVLIDIQHRPDAVVPELVPTNTPAAKIARRPDHASAGAAKLRLIG